MSRKDNSNRKRMPSRVERLKDFVAELEEVVLHGGLLISMVLMLGAICVDHLHDLIKVWSEIA